MKTDHSSIYASVLELEKLTGYKFKSVRGKKVYFKELVREIRQNIFDFADISNKAEELATHILVLAKGVELAEELNTGYCKNSFFESLTSKEQMLLFRTG